jgi:CheY-like chemotaxis protein
MNRNLADEAAPDEMVPSYVLVVDDEGVVRQFLTRCLETWGYTVRQAGSASEALELMADRPASLVLCDIRMPGQDGLWLAERLHEHWPKVPLVMATAIDDVQTIRQSRDLGAVDYITKPIMPEQLHQALRRAISPPGHAVAPSDPPDSDDEPTPPVAFQAPPEERIEAEYTLECPVRCPSCGERIETVKAVRLIRAQVNFTSTLPRRGRVIVCSHCLAIIPGELTNF